MNPVATHTFRIRQTHLRWLDEQCPAGAYAMAVQHRDGPHYSTADRGHALHLCASRYVKHLASHARQTDWSAVPVLLDQVLKEFPTLTWEEIQDVTDQFTTIGKQFVLDYESFWGAEESFETTIVLEDGQEVVLTGTLDLLEVTKEGVARVTDWKSVYRIPAKGEIDESFQLIDYALLVMDNLPEVQSVEGYLWFTRYGFKAGPAVFTRDDVEKFRTHVSRLLQSFLMDSKLQHEFRPGTYCQYCPRRRPGDCSFWRRSKDGQGPPPRTFYQARHIARRAIALEQQRALLIDQLKSYVDEKGPLSLQEGGEKFAYHVSDKETFTAEDVWEVLHSPEVKALIGDYRLSDVFSVNQESRFFKDLRKAPDIKYLFDDVAGRKMSTSFTHKKPKKQEK